MGDALDLFSFSVRMGEVEVVEVVVVVVVVVVGGVLVRETTGDRGGESGVIEGRRGDLDEGLSDFTPSACFSFSSLSFSFSLSLSFSFSLSTLSFLGEVSSSELGFPSRRKYMNRLYSKFLILSFVCNLSPSASTGSGEEDSSSPSSSLSLSRSFFAGSLLSKFGFSLPSSTEPDPPRSSPSVSPCLESKRNAHNTNSIV